MFRTVLGLGGFELLGRVGGVDLKPAFDRLARRNELAQLGAFEMLQGLGRDGDDHR